MTLNGAIRIETLMSRRNELFVTGGLALTSCFCLHTMAKKGDRADDGIADREIASV